MTKVGHGHYTAALHRPYCVHCVQVLISKEPTVAGRVAAHVAGLEDELDLLKQLDHPNIVRYLVSSSPPLFKSLLLCQILTTAPCTWEARYAS